MAISARVARLRQESLDTRPTLSTERAELMTEFYAQGWEGRVSAPVLRAMAFQYLLEHKAIHIGADELIVGEKGPAPKAAPTYPELCCHSLQDLEILNSRPKIPFAVSPQARRVYEQTVIPFWQGRSMRDRIFAEMTPEWQAAYEAGLFTEFMEQRAPATRCSTTRSTRRACSISRPRSTRPWHSSTGSATPRPTPASNNSGPCASPQER